MPLCGPEEFFGDGVLVSSASGVDGWLRDLDVHGPLHEHHESGLVFFVAPAGTPTAGQCAALLLPGLPGEAAVYTHSTSSALLLDAFPGAAPGPVTWLTGPSLDTAAGSVRYFDIHQEDAHAAPFFMTAHTFGPTAHVTVGIDHEWGEPRYLLLRHHNHVTGP